MVMRVRGCPQAARIFVVGLLVVGAALAAPLRSEARQPGELTVMTQNLYLGSSLAPALEATDGPSFVAAVATIYGTMLFTDFPSRAEAIASEIAAARPDLIGLQEVSRWTASPTHPGPTPPSLDFLSTLLRELNGLGLHYAVAAVSENADIGPAPLVAPTFGCLPFTTVPDCVVSLHDRDVILVNTDTAGLSWSNPAHGNFTAQQTVHLPVPPPDGSELSFDRCWTSIDGNFQGDRFRFVNTHLETEDFPAVQEAQALELLIGPMRPGRSVIAVGDFNSAADGSTTRSYRLLTQLWFKDAWTSDTAGFTCCQNDSLTNPVSELSSRIDLVLTQAPIHATGAHVVSDEIFQTTPPLWPSDHAGVIATVQLR
jgi:endonuclease/exonuclease/phosphatase family metal-dependent hydrolase